MTDAELRRVARAVLDELDGAADRATDVAVRVVVGSPFPGRVAPRPEEAAAAIGLSRDAFDAHVKPDLRVIRRGRLVLIPCAELTRWCERNAAQTLSEERGGA